mmetsp:Transcript_34983/g.85732  ORF Transcript_34983/g.85732 Transcript_34983/m.85732 type:complete len:216 (-) Transcript_34983:1146-1793(-)
MSLLQFYKYGISQHCSVRLCWYSKHVAACDDHVSGACVIVARPVWLPCPSFEIKSRHSLRPPPLTHDALTPTSSRTPSRTHAHSSVTPSRTNELNQALNHAFNQLSSHSVSQSQRSHSQRRRSREVIIRRCVSGGGGVGDTPGGGGAAVDAAPVPIQQPRASREDDPLLPLTPSIARGSHGLVEPALQPPPDALLAHHDTHDVGVIGHLVHDVRE